MTDYLGTEKFCKSCDDCKDMVCQNEKSDFHGFNVSSVLLVPCHSKWGRSDIKLENPTIIKED
jgi:hypothetical protein